MTSDFPSATLTAKRKHGNVSIFSVLWVRVYDPHSSFKKNYLKMFSPEQSEWFLHFFLLSQGCFSCSRAYVFHTNFRISLFMSTENLVGIPVGITLNLKINLNRADIFIGLNHLIHEYSMSLHWFRFSFFKFHFNFLTPKTFCIAV